MDKSALTDKVYIRDETMHGGEQTPGVAFTVAEKRVLEALDYATAQGLTVDFISEDTSRSELGFVNDLITNAVEYGADKIILCDTVSSKLNNPMLDEKNGNQDPGGLSSGTVWHALP